VRPNPEIEEMGVGEITFFDDPFPATSGLKETLRRRINVLQAKTGRRFLLLPYGFEFGVRRIK